jgi:hypothetical protein
MRSATVLIANRATYAVTSAPIMTANRAERLNDLFALNATGSPGYGTGSPDARNGAGPWLFRITGRRKSYNEKANSSPTRIVNSP